jgi:lipopolysaccharide transport system permease protein
VTTTPIHHYSAEAARHGILHHVYPVLGYPGVMVKNGGLVWNFFRRELLGRFRGSLLGIFWVLVQPIFLFAIFFLVFGFIFAHPRGPDAGGGPNVWFALYLFSGIIAFSSFSEATTRSCGVVVENGNLVKKVAFPCELLPVSQVLVSMMVYFVGAVVLMAVGLPTGKMQLGLDFLAWPVLVLVQAVMALGLGLFLACLHVFLRDTLHLYTIFAQAWFFLSPVFWAPMQLKENLADYWFLFTWNPLYPLIIAHRQVLGIALDPKGLAAGVDGSVWYHIGLAATWAASFLIVGYSFFVSRKHRFADLV